MTHGPGHAVGYVVFDTAVGRCGVAWSEAGIVGVQLPEAGGPHATGRRLAKRFPDARSVSAPPPVARAIIGMIALLEGARDDLRDVVLDVRGVPPFNARVYALARAILPGSTSTYGELARQLGDPTAARGVGQALAQNPFPIVVPCHRILAAGGGLGGFSARGGRDTKRALLAIEGATSVDQLPLFGGKSD